MFPRRASSFRDTSSKPACVLSATLLNEVTVTLHTADGESRRVPMSPNAKRIQLLAYLAWQQDEFTTRKKIFKEVLRHGLAKAEATPEKLENKLYAHVKLLRRDIRNAVAQLNAERGGNVLPTDIDPFEQIGGLWRLSSLWKTDLAMIEEYAQAIPQANRELNLGPLTQQTKETCEALIAAYPGDFLATMIQTYPEEFHPIERCWVREPYTYYRECYLRAFWCLAEDKWNRGKAREGGQLWEHYEQAAALFRTYAFTACVSWLDTAVSFEESSLRVMMSERALRRTLDVYHATGKRQDFEACYHDYTQHMQYCSEGKWRPGDTLQEFLQSIIW